MNTIVLDKIIKNALEEDLAWGDITTESTIPNNSISNARLIAKEAGVLCGIDVFERVMKTVDNSINIAKNFKDGDSVDKGCIIAIIQGPSKSILSAERVALNLIQRMSGISTATANIVAKISSTKTKIADTRKTTPGLRMLEKYAVRVGGGSNHRYNLADGVLIKDNHINAAGSITNAVTAARAYIPHTVKIEVETESLEQVQEALDCCADIIMLDNMDTVTMKKAVELIDRRALTEASGNMGERDLLEVAHTGVDIISIGALTHTVKAMDISLRF
jgi:nicotinate-nucleotide pyrophosphorylase (carboxylating)